MPHARNIGAKRRAAQIVERRRERALYCCANRWLETGQDALAVGLAERNEPGTGGDPVRNNRMKKSVKRRLQRNRMRRADDSNSDRIDHRTAARCDHPIKRAAAPRRAGDVDERAALRRGFKLALARRHKSESQFGNLAKCYLVTASRGAVSVCQKHGIAKSRSIADHRIEPTLQ